MTERRLSNGLGIRGGKGRDRQTTQELEETFEDDRYVHYLEYDDGFTFKYICVKIYQTVHFNICSFVISTSIKMFFKIVTAIFFHSKMLKYFLFFLV